MFLYVDSFTLLYRCCSDYYVQCLQEEAMVIVYNVLDQGSWRMMLWITKRRKLLFLCFYCLAAR